MEKMATRKGLEPSTSAVTGRRSNRLSYRAIFCISKRAIRLPYGGWYRIRTCDPRLVRAMLYQLS